MNMLIGCYSIMQPNQQLAICSIMGREAVLDALVDLQTKNSLEGVISCFSLIYDGTDTAMSSPSHLCHCSNYRSYMQR